MAVISVLLHGTVQSHASHIDGSPSDNVMFNTQLPILVLFCNKV